MSESRRYRREMAKQLGFLSKKETYSQMMERYKRSIQMGEVLHTQHLQNIKNQEILKSEEDLKSQKTEVSEDSPLDENPYGFLGKR
jgi:uncharacterized protein YdiU (UPF0061 family)